MREIKEGDVVCLKSDKDRSVVFTVGRIYGDIYDIATCYFIQDNSIPSNANIPLITLTKI